MVPPWGVTMLRLTFWAVAYLAVILLAVLAIMPTPLPMLLRWAILAALILGVVLDARQKSAPSPPQR